MVVDELVMVELVVEEVALVVYEELVEIIVLEGVE